MDIQKIIEQKKEWNSFNKRIKALPKDYQIVYKEMQKYLFKVTIADEQMILDLYSGIVELFEYGASQGKGVLEVTGEDVAAFCDCLIADNESYDDYAKSHVQKVYNDLIELGLITYKQIAAEYGADNLQQVFPTKQSEKMWALGVSLYGMFGGGPGMLSSGVHPSYYLYLDQKIIKVIGNQKIEYQVHQIKDNQYLANNNWFCMEAIADN